jgi:hypothetical protein
MEVSRRRDAAARFLAAGERDRAVCPSAQRTSSLRSASWRSLPGLVKRWRTREIKKTPVKPGGLGEDLGKDMPAYRQLSWGAVTNSQGRWGAIYRTGEVCCTVGNFVGSRLHGNTVCGRRGTDAPQDQERSLVHDAGSRTQIPL